MNTKVRVILKNTLLKNTHEYSRLLKRVFCYQRVSLNKGTPGKEWFSGQFYPEQSVFYGFIGEPEGSSDVNATRSKWMIANSSFLNITFQSDDIFNNFGTSLTFKCSNSSHFNGTEKGKKDHISCLNTII